MGISGRISPGPRSIRLLSHPTVLGLSAPQNRAGHRYGDAQQSEGAKRSPARKTCPKMRPITH